FRDRLAARMEPAALAQRDELLDDRAQVLRLGEGRRDLLVLDQRRAHVREHRAAMLVRAVELAVGVTVTHRIPLVFLDARRASPANSAPGFLSNGPRTVWRARRCSPAASPALPCRDGGPSAPALP